MTKMRMMRMRKVETRAAPPTSLQRRRHAGEAPVQAAAPIWSCWAVELCWLPSDWDAIFWCWLSRRRVSDRGGRASSTGRAATSAAPAHRLAGCSAEKAPAERVNKACPPPTRCCPYRLCLTATPPARCCTPTARSAWRSAPPPRRPSPSDRPATPPGTH